MILSILAIYCTASAEERVFPPEQLRRNITAKGECAIVGMTDEQCRQLALQRARASAIEQAAGMSVSSSTLVTNMALAAEFIKTYSKGIIVNEGKPRWTGSFYQKDPSSEPIPEYRVEITADVYIPAKKIAPIGLDAKLNSGFFRSKEKASLDIQAGRKAKIAVFNLTADDKVVMVLPNEYEKAPYVSPDAPLRFPADKARFELIMQTLPGHKKDAEAFFVVAMDPDQGKDFIRMFRSVPMSFEAFFKKYAEIADISEDSILTYEVVGE